MTDERRKGRINTIIREVLTGLIERELKDPRIGFVTLTGVEISSDLSVAKVYYTVLGDENVRKESRRGILSAAGYMRKKVGEALDLRRTPELRFLYDESVERGLALEDTLVRLREEDETRKDRADEGGGDSTPRGGA
jgi:ribosome-binding factor A